MNELDGYDLTKLSEDEKMELLRLLHQKEMYKKHNKVKFLFPDEGKLSRHNYQKHMEFFEAGAHYKERLNMSANRVGKSIGGGSEVSWHTTGLYPHWWKGHVFKGPNDWYVIGDTSDSVRKVLQEGLLGKVGEFGTGLIPKDCIDFKTLTDAQKTDTKIKEVKIKHVSGGYSTITFMSSEQGRLAFQGVELDGIWIDEECPYPIYEEAITRVMTKEGIIILTFTPLNGLTPLVKSFLGSDLNASGEVAKHRYVVRIDWDDVPHLSAKDKEELLASYSPHQRLARSKGIPTLGSGAIYSFNEDEVVVEPFEIPKWWPKAYGMDVGRNTASIFFAENRDEGIIYVYSEMFMKEGTPSQHTEAVKARGTWLKGAIDTSARGRSPTDGENLFKMYTDLGLNIQNADKAVEAGIYTIQELFNAGRLKIFSSCKGLLDELRMYRREDGKIVKEDDHRADAFRYGIHTRHKILQTEAENEAKKQPVLDFDEPIRSWGGSDGWMAN